MDTIVAQQEVTDLPRRGRVNLLHFHQGMVLMVSGSAVGLYRDRGCVDDPLGNGLLGYQAIPESLQGQADEQHGWILEQTSGYVRLSSGAVLFLRPDGVALFPDNDSALRNRNLQWLIPYQ